MLAFLTAALALAFALYICWSVAWDSLLFGNLFACVGTGLEMINGEHGV